MAQGSNLFDLMAEMAKNPKLLEKFRENPRKVMKKYGLKKAQMDLIESSVKGGNQHDFHKAVGDETHRLFPSHHSPNTVIETISC